MTLVASIGACVGNDVVDLSNARQREPLEREWMERHLTGWERDTLGVPSPVAFWTIFSAKEAGYKAFLQAGITTPHGAFSMIEANLADGRVRHLPSGESAELLDLTVTADSIHTVALFSPGGEETASATVSSGIGYVPETVEASDYVRERLLASIAARLPDAAPEELAVGSRNGIPKVILRGRFEDWSVSLSHSGRLAAWAWVASNGHR